MALCLMLSVSACGGKTTPIPNNNSVNQPKNTGISSDIERTGAHEDITWDLITIVEHDAELKRLLEKSIKQAKAENPDTDTNPVVSLESYYQFIDRIVKAMPWEIIYSWVRSTAG